MNNIMVIIFIVILLFLIMILVQEIKKQKKRNPIKYPNNKIKFQSNTSLDKKLLRMLNGDEKVALRLIRNVRLKHPGKSYTWYQEKRLFLHIGLLIIN